MDFIDKIESYAKEPNKIAQIYRSSRLTYKELKDKSDALACYISEKFGEDKSPILIYGHKQHEMLISFLACSKSGHAYIPMDITFPAARVNTIIESSKSNILLSIGELEHQFNNVEVINLIELDNIINKYMGNVPDRHKRVKDDDNYYILYTSGSTGNPKGVQITKGCLGTFIDWFKVYFEEIGDNKIVIDQPAYSFDLSVANIYMTLTTGKTLYVIDKKMVENYKELFDNLRKSDIDFWITTPSFANMCLVDESFNYKLLPKMEKMIFIGEVLNKNTVIELFNRFPNVIIINAYGPTETTVAITGVEISNKMLESDKPIPVGYVMNDGKVIFVDEDEKQVVSGEKGELVFIGDSVSPGYYNNEELTKKSFFNLEEDGRVKRAYKTGDLAYMDEDGLIYYCGRKDFQIKLNGYRIEIEDIENNIRKLEFINNTVVLPVYKNEKISHLAAFITLNQESNEKEFKIALRVKKELKKLIPDYMVPRTIKVKKSFDVNSNGKIDRKLLMEELI